MGSEADTVAAARILKKCGIRYSIRRGGLFIDSRDWRKYSKLCEEGKLPDSVC